MKVIIHSIPNFGDLLNIPLLNYYFDDKPEFIPYGQIGRKGKAFMGIGTLIDYIIPLDWFSDKHITFLGTGAAKTEQRFTGEAKGFVRGKLSGVKMGISGLGDLGILVDRIYGFPSRKKSKTAVVLDKTGEAQLVINTKLPEPQMITAACRNVMHARGFYDELASCSFVITDRLHVAVAAEAMETPWIVWNHQQGDLIHTPEKFLDWASGIGKERFVIGDLSTLDVIYENIDFTKSKEQKEVLEDALRKLKQEVKI